MVGLVEAVEEAMQAVPATHQAHHQRREVMVVAAAQIARLTPMLEVAVELMLWAQMLHLLLAVTEVMEQLQAFPVLALLTLEVAVAAHKEAQEKPLAQEAPVAVEMQQVTIRQRQQEPLAQAAVAVAAEKLQVVVTVAQAAPVS
jgi:hypothetical protein